MEATITDKNVHGSMKPLKGSEAVKEERSKKLSEAVWSFSFFVSFLSLSGAERERNEKKIYSFNAKEFDEETGMYYYEARYYKPPVFTSRDPHFERYFWTTPYGYCSNNPLKYVDPTGMGGELVGSEEDIQTALKYIQNAAPNMKLEIQENVDDIGSKTYKLVMGEGGVAKTKYEKQLEEAINSTDIKFVISLEENNGQAGSYYGTEYDEGSKQYVSTNKVNLNEMNVLEGTKYVKGSGLMHEMTEGYEMGKIAKRENRKTIERAWRDEGYSLVSKDS